MKYSYFIQKTRGPGGKTTHTFMMLPSGNEQRAGEQSKLQRLITSHNMHTCVNIPPLEGTRLKFKGSYAKLEKDYHPALVIISSRDGSFRLPFAAGDEGLAELQKVYAGIVIAFRQFENASLARVGSQNYGNRIAYNGAHPEPTNDRPVSPQARQTRSGAAQAQRQNVVYLRGGAAPPANDMRREPAPSQTPPPGPQKPPQSGNKPSKPSVGGARKTGTSAGTVRFMKWVAVGATISVLVTGLLAASHARAGESDSTTIQVKLENELLGGAASSDDGFAGFPVPPLLHDNQPVVAAPATACGIPGIDTSENFDLGLTTTTPPTIHETGGE